jgi:acetate kinase
VNVARILVVNAGSSTLKLSLIGERDETLASRELAVPGSRVDPGLLALALREPLGEAGAIGDRHSLGDADAVGHRIVHGGEQFRSAVVIDPEVEGALRELTELAPLHQPKSLPALDAVSAALPSVPAVACFDTAFHADMPPAARTYALPAAWRERWPIRRYGFHGLSHAWVARRVPELLETDSDVLRIVSCHLGAGASLCAIAGGRSIATTMGFTPLEGLVMATRSGSVDPGLLLWLLEHSGMSTRELGDALEEESGQLGLAGTADMREVLERREAGDPAAELALSVYLQRLREEIGAMAAVLGGLDALAFTGGVGERSPAIRREATAGLGFMGVRISEQLNREVDGDADITLRRTDAPWSAHARTLVIHAREDLEIARQVRAILQTPRSA